MLVWNASGRYSGYVTGVGKHVMYMVNGLSQREGTDLSMLVPNDEWKTDGAVEDGPMARIPTQCLPYSRKWMEASWRLAKTPAIDRWAGGADWIYCPRELYVPVTKARYAVTVHDVYRIEVKQNGLQALRQRQTIVLLARALRAATLVLTVSEFTKSRLEDLFGISAAKVRVVGNGVEGGYFKIGQRDPEIILPIQNEPYVLAMGGLTAKKGANDVLKFAKALKEVAPTVNIISIGVVEPEYRSELAAANNLHVLGRGICDQNLQHLLRGAIASVVLSRYEGFGIPVLEAMAAGVPAIAMRRTALPEVAGGAGVLIDPAEPETAACMVRELIDNDAFRCDLISRGHAHARKFTWDACADRLGQALEEFSANRAKQTG